MESRFTFSLARLMLVIAFVAGTIAAGRLLGAGPTGIAGALLTPVMLMLSICTFVKGKDGLLLVLAAAFSTFLIFALLVFVAWMSTLLG